MCSYLQLQWQQVTPSKVLAKYNQQGLALLMDGLQFGQICFSGCHETVSCRNSWAVRFCDGIQSGDIILRNYSRRAAWLLWCFCSMFRLGASSRLWNRRMKHDRYCGEYRQSTQSPLRHCVQPVSFHNIMLNVGRCCLCLEAALPENVSNKWSSMRFLFVSLGEQGNHLHEYQIDVTLSDLGYMTHQIK